MADIDPAAIELPPTQPIDITAILAEISGQQRASAVKTPRPADAS